VCTIFFVLLLSCGNKHKICCYVDIHDKNDEANEKSEASHSEEAMKSASKKSKSITGKGKPSKMQVEFENAMKEHNTYLESDKMFLSEMKEGAKERELRKDKLSAYKDSMALLANAIAGRSQLVQQPYYNVHHDIDSQQTFYKF
jgi:hypothetical protein